MAKKKPITLSYRGETKTIKEWCMVHDVYKSTLYNRVIAGWPAEHCINGRPDGYVAKTKRRCNTKTFFWKGRDRTLKEISDLECVPYYTLYTRMYRGCDDIATIVRGNDSRAARAKAKKSLDIVWGERCGI